MPKILMIKLLGFSFASILSAFLVSHLAWADIGGVQSLRGVVELDAHNRAVKLKRIPRDRGTFERDYLHQPPLIPHQIRGYKIDLNSNKCLSCHSWTNYKKIGATKVSFTHFDTRDGTQLSDVSPRRYFCHQCHVPQADAQPLVKSTFIPMKLLAR